MAMPKRRYVLTLNIGGDAIEDIIRSFNQIADDIKCGSVGPSISGSYSSGWHWDLEFNPDMTHDIYEQKLDEYLQLM